MLALFLPICDQPCAIEGVLLGRKWFKVTMSHFYSMFCFFLLLRLIVKQFGRPSTWRLRKTAFDVIYFMYTFYEHFYQMANKFAGNRGLSSLPLFWYFSTLRYGIVMHNAVVLA